MKINFRFLLLLIVACLTFAQTCFASIMECETPTDYYLRLAAHIAADILFILGCGIFLIPFVFDILHIKRLDADIRRKKCLGWSFFLILLAILFGGVQQCVM